MAISSPKEDPMGIPNFRFSSILRILTNFIGTKRLDAVKNSFTNKIYHSFKSIKDYSQ